MNVRDTWLEARRKGIGASDIAAVLGVSPWATPYQLYLDKRGELPQEDEKPVLHRGKRFEPVVLQFYEDETGHAVTRQQEHVVGAEPWMLATLDGFDAVVGAPVEAKTRNEFYRRDEFGEPGTDEVPIYYGAQVYWQMMITDADAGYLAAMIGLDDFRIYRFERDPDLESLLVARGREFWTMVENGTPPEPRTDTDVKLMYRKDSGASIEASPDVVAACERLRAIKAEAKELEAEVDGLSMQIKSAMGAASVLTGPGGKPMATWKAAKDSQKTDWQAIAMALMAPPELVAEHTKDVPGSRRFLLK